MASIFWEGLEEVEFMLGIQNHLKIRGSLRVSLPVVLLINYIKFGFWKFLLLGYSARDF